MLEAREPADPRLPAELRLRLLDDLTHGRTIALPADQLARADVRACLPQLFDELRGEAEDGASRLKIAGYTVLGEIGHGGMSTVYLARHVALDRCVALKVVPNWLGGQERARERLLREARALARLSHPNIVTVYDIVDRGDTIAIAMEWVDGLTLAGLLQSLPLEPADDDMEVLRKGLGAPATGSRLEASVNRTFVRMMVDVARAVHCVHQNGLLHLDIKPSNVLVRRDGTALLADFGVVREVDLALTHTGSFAGTPIYAAPEQLRRDTRALTPATDVYGLGITLYELLARSRPLRQEGLTKLLQDIQAGRIPPLASRAKVPADLANIVHKAISPVPGRRYASAAAFADDLQAFLDGHPVTARPLTRTERAARWVRAEPWKALLAVALGVTLPVLGGLSLVLVGEQNNIAAGKKLLLGQQVAEVVNDGFQNFLVRQELGEEGRDALAKAHRDDPSDASALATLLVTLAQERPAEALEWIGRCRQQGITSRGLDLVQQRVEAGRAYFTTEEVSALRRSNAPIDVYLSILDRILWDLNTGNDEDLVEVSRDLDAAVLVGGPSPLLLGLRAWAAGRTGNTKVLEESERALTANWPTAGAINTWRSLAWELIDPQQALARAEETRTSDPTSSAAQNQYVRSLAALGRLEEALAAVPSPKVPEPHYDCWRAGLLAKLGHRADAAKLLPPPDRAARWPSTDYLRALAAVDPDAAQREFDKIVAAVDRPPIRLLLDAVDTAGKRVDMKAVEAAARRGLAEFPERHAFRWALASACWQTRRLDEAAPLVEGLTLPQHTADVHGPGLARTLAWKKDWTALLQMTDRWLQYGKVELQRAHYYRGLALLRLGRRDEGEQSLRKHQRIATELDRSKPQAKPRHYVQAYYELVWAALDPRQPAERRYPQAGKEECTQLRAVLERNRGHSAWFGFIVAELQAADGARESALQQALAAKALLHDKPSAEAPADLPQLLDGLIERLQR